MGLYETIDERHSDLPEGDTDVDEHEEVADDHR